MGNRLIQTQEYHFGIWVAQYYKPDDGLEKKELSRKITEFQLGKRTKNNLAY